MPEILKRPNGETNWLAIFSAFAASAILILQQMQAYRIAEIQAQAEANKINFLDKEEVTKIGDKLRERLFKLELRVTKLEKYHEGE